MNWNEFANKIFSTSKDREELKQLNTWVDQDKESALHLQQMADIWDVSDQLDTYFDVDVDAAFNKCMGAIEESDTNHRVIEDSENSNIISFFSQNKWIGIAASLFVVVAATFLLFNQNKTTGLVYEASSELRTISLEDGTDIDLFSKGTFVYHQDENAVVLNGSADFDVAKQAGQPFKVQVPQGEINVVGTRFNVHSGSNQSIIHLYEGKVRLKNKSNQTVSLTAGQMATITENDIKIESYRTGASVYISYNDMPLTEVIAELQTMFDVQIACNKEMLPTEVITSTFNNMSILQILDELSLISNKTFSLK